MSAGTPGPNDPPHRTPPLPATPPQGDVPPPPAAAPGGPPPAAPPSSPPQVAHAPEAGGPGTGAPHPGGTQPASTSTAAGPPTPPGVGHQYSGTPVPADEGIGSAGGAAPGGTPPPPPHGPHDGPWATFAPPPRRRRRGGLLAAVAVATLIAGGIGGGAGYLLADNAGSDRATSTVNSSNGSSGTQERSPESVAGIAESALPSVVTIQAEGDREGGTGTGFVYDEEGHILTNNHVVESASQSGRLTVTFSDGESYEAELVGGAQGYDIAVLRLVDSGDRDLQPLPVGNSDDVVVGDTTVAIGAPYGLSGTVTTGIVSAKNRPVASSDGMGGRSSYMSALQTDASINPGNSGGPLLDAGGAVIGVNSAIQSNSSAPGQQAGSVGLGFAIPVNQAVRVANDLIESGEPVYAVIGVSVGMTETSSGGAQISTEGEGANEAVTPGGPADEAGLRPGDSIIKFGDRVIDSGPTLISEIWTYEPGETVELTYVRDGNEQTTEITLDARVGDQE
ncbi:PDZ domain-containing protein [Streptomyces sp. ventii]|uniref:PDZ domain-containing protein n=2 Tax=Streptomyces spiramenti TaxID=2720606 RepID=A0ABX1AKY8_9ACTN|nr:trypsin-like peptidase domain-containing protein [Streptomyces spiramenti]NJP64940.1 PDZ domain-containing protein [Streptomyces spiramenti]